MKKVLSTLLAVALMLSLGMSAWAAEEPAGDHSHVISDINLFYDSQLIDLSDIVIEMDVAGDDGAKAGRLHVNLDGETVAELGVTVLEDGVCVLHMDSQTGGHKDYGIDPAVILSRIMKGGIDSLTSLLQSIDVDGAARGIIDRLMSAGDAPVAEEPAEDEQTPSAPGAYINFGGQVIDLSSISIEGDPMAVIKDCISEPETTHMGGVEYAANGNAIEIPDGEYEVNAFSFDTEAICKLLDMVYVDGEPAGLGDKLRESGVDILFAGNYFDNDAAHIGSISAGVTTEGLVFNGGVGYNQVISDEGTKTTYSFGLSSGADLESASVTGLSFTISDGTHEGEQFTAASVDRDALIMLTDMDADQAMAELNEALGTVLADMLTTMLQPVSEVMTGPGPAVSGEGAE